MTRFLLVVLLTLGILAPRASAIVVDLMPGSFETIVICTGYEMQTIVVDAEGAPVKLGDAESHPCVFKAGVDLPAQGDAPLWVTLVRADVSPLAKPDLLRTPLAAVLPPPSQGPPLFV